MRIINKDMRKEVVRLCKLYSLTLRQGSKGIKLYDRTGRLVGCAHQTLSDVRAIENFRHEVEGRIHGRRIVEESL